MLCLSGGTLQQAFAATVHEVGDVELSCWPQQLWCIASVRAIRCTVAAWPTKG